MQAIEIEQLSQKYADYFAIFFTDDGILLHSLTSSPLLPFGKTVEKLGVALEAVYLNSSILVVKCKKPLTVDQMHSDGFYIQNPRAVLASINEEGLSQIVLRTLQWFTWDELFQYCSKCGSPIQRSIKGTERKCGLCTLSFFPKFSPAIIVLIQRRDEILLARSAHFKPGVYSVIAGFIDMGETAETAVHREVKEEVGIDISDLQYFGTQSWPFPDSFMIAFKAKYLRGEINVDVTELEDARWFNVNNLPPLPSYPSISRKLIDSSL